jgi:hypothetical protein
MERVWTRIKAAADMCRSAGVSFTLSQSRSIVLEICRQEQADRPSPAILEQLASELVRLTKEGGGPPEYSKQPMRKVSSE